MMKLEWSEKKTGAGAVYWEAFVHDYEKKDGVRFWLQDFPAFHLRGRYKLLVDVAAGQNYDRWGDLGVCARFYHSVDNAKSEAQAIASALWEERFRVITTGTRNHGLE